MQMKEEPDVVWPECNFRLPVMQEYYSVFMYAQVINNAVRLANKKSYNNHKSRLIPLVLLWKGTRELEEIVIGTLVM